MDGDPLLRILLGILGISSILPLALLFVDHSGPKAIHRPVLFVIALVVTFAGVIPIALKVLGIWAALLAPALFFVYVLVTRRS
ncbi:MAG: hypothetical protein KDB84_07390 [Flavobacteriales bacterium]|nr:hypothetical protein [Flavobacteriales bacterium]